MGWGLRGVAPVGALALGVLLLVGLIGMLVRPPWGAPCTVRSGPGEPLAQGSVADMRRFVTEALEPAGARGEGTGGATGRAGARGAGSGEGAGTATVAQLRSALASGPVLTCTIRPIASADEPKDQPLGLTPRARELRAEVRDAFGAIPTGGYGPEPVLPGRAPGGEHSLGRAIDFFFRPHGDPSERRRGWLLANWAVANAQRLGIRTVIYADHIWTARRSAQGWRDYRFRGANPDSPVNRHLDHVHIDVA